MSFNKRIFSSSLLGERGKRVNESFTPLSRQYLLHGALLVLGRNLIILGIVHIEMNSSNIFQKCFYRYEISNDIISSSAC